MLFGTEHGTQVKEGVCFSELSTLDRLQGPRRSLVICLALASPIVILLLLLETGVRFYLIILIYGVIVVEGCGLGIWGLASAHASQYQLGGSKKSRSTSRYWDRNRAETLADYVRSASGKKSVWFREHSRSEISKVLKEILSERQEYAIGSPQIESAEDERNLRDEIEYLLRPPNQNKSKSMKADDPIIKVRKKSFDYLSSLEHVLSKIESDR